MEVPKPQIPTFLPTKVEPQMATTGQRFGNLILDGFAIWILQAIFIGLLHSAASEIGFGWVWFNLLTPAVYYIVMETTFGKTFGKYVTKTKVLKADGSELDFGTVVVRTIIRFIPFDALSFFFYGARPAGWHDQWSKTKVVEDK